MYASDLIGQAAVLFGVTPAELVGRSRAQHIAQARQAVAYALRQVTVLSLVEIGRALGGRDHTTILYAVQAAEARAVVDADYALRLSALLPR